MTVAVRVISFILFIFSYISNKVREAVKMGLDSTPKGLCQVNYSKLNTTT